MNTADYVSDLFALTGKTAIVAGGAGVIGLVMTEAMLRAGANVMIWSRSQASVDEALKGLEKAGIESERISGAVVDTGTESQVEAGLHQTIQHFGPVEILINAVGGNMGKAPFIEMDVDLFEKVLRMNLVAGLVVPSKVIGRYWMEQSIKGSIINLASMTSYKPLSGVWAYDAAKAGVLNLTAATAKEFAPHGIRVNAIAPGFFLGKQNKALLVDQETGELTARGREVISRTPFARFGDARELTGATLFLASNQASGFVTGTSIPVDGGFLVDNI